MTYRDTDPYTSSYSIREKVAAGIGAILSVLALNACGSSAKDMPPKTLESHSATANPSETPSSSDQSSTDALSPSTEASPMASVETTEPSNPPSTSESLTYDDLDAMPAKKFNKLPLLEDRLGWVLPQLQEINDNGYLSDFLDQKFTDDGTSLAEWSPYWNPLGRDASPEDILKQASYAEQVVFGSKADLSVDGNGPLDKERARKMMSFLSLDPHSHSFESYMETIDNSTKATRLTDETINDMKVVDKPSLKQFKVKGYNKDETPAKTFTVRHVGQNVEVTYVFIPCLNDGKGIWLEQDRSDL